ncbi:hypothetical protein OHA72_51310 [Dactylosporangium sp. NBC_01737]|uniref:hypothetical protein n=1 Tax=Dactylosporangium sp. NBC_01737 TaxID=2975959 RepID=UPI002E140C4B|nr:hypothetical protein OHA72_51310 [Dactylosporangium sp. NBC_01737]
MISPLPAYAVPDVKPAGGTDDLRRVWYWGSQLATYAPVAAVLDRIPAVMTTIEEAWPGHTLTTTRAQLCAVVGVGTGDGLLWGLSFFEEVGFLVQPYQSYQESDPDLVEEALAAQPDVDSADQVDTGQFEVRMARVHRADEMAARWLDAIMTAHREFARRRGIDLPY